MSRVATAAEINSLLNYQSGPLLHGYEYFTRISHICKQRTKLSRLKANKKMRLFVILKDFYLVKGLVDKCGEVTTLIRKITPNQRDHLDFRSFIFKV